MTHKALDLRVNEIFQPVQIFFRQTATDMCRLPVRSDNKRVFEIIAVMDNVNIFQMLRFNQNADWRKKQPFRLDPYSLTGNDNSFASEK